MSDKTFIPDIPAEKTAPASQIGATFESLCATISQRKDAGEESYTYQLLKGNLDTLLKKVSEEALEVALAAKEAQMLDAYSSSEELHDHAVDHLRYEAADVIYHLLVVLERFDIPLDELAAELNTRMTVQERPVGGICLQEEHVRRGK